MSQGSILDRLDSQEARARVSDPQTSKDAAKGVDTRKAYKGIYDTLLKHKNGLASFEIANILGVPRDYVSPNMKPMERMGLIFRSGIKIKNPDSGKFCEVWRASTEERQREILEHRKDSRHPIKKKEIGSGLKWVVMKLQSGLEVIGNPVTWGDLIPGASGALIVFEDYESAITYNNNSTENIMPIKLV